MNWYLDLSLRRIHWANFTIEPFFHSKCKVDNGRGGEGRGWGLRLNFQYKEKVEDYFENFGKKL